MEKTLEKLKSTLKVFNEKELKSGPGIVPGQTVKSLVGSDLHPTERMRSGLASFEAGTLEHLHWHLIEVFYYVISGRAVMTDIEGKTYDIGPGTVVYAPPGIAASHQWDIKEPLQLISFRACTDETARIQFTVDPSTKQSSIEYKYLMRGAGGKFKKSLYTT